MDYDVGIVKRRRIISPAEAYFARAAAAAAYVGPGDINGAAVGWWGLRAFNAAYATGSNPAMDVVKTSDGTGGGTINILADGSLDVATIAAFGYAVSVSKLYDQSGGGFHLLQATLAAMPTITLSGLGSLPTLNFNGSQYMVSVNQSVLSQPYSISFVGYHNSASGSGVFLGDDTQNATIVRSDGTNLLLYAGVGVTKAFSTNAFHAMQGLFNGASSAIYLDGSNTAGNAGATGTTNDGWSLGAQAGAATKLTGKILECGVWSGDKSASHASVNSNQHTYWGF